MQGDGFERAIGGLLRGLDLAEGLGEALVAIARESVAANFAGEHDPDGNPWPALGALTEDNRYGRWKAVRHPGKPMGELHGELLQGIPGEPDVTPDAAVYTFGTNERQRREVAWFSEGDPAQNRPPRPFVGLNEAARGKARDAISQHLKGNA